MRLDTEEEGDVYNKWPESARLSPNQVLLKQRLLRFRVVVNVLCRPHPLSLWKAAMFINLLLLSCRLRCFPACVALPFACFLPLVHAYLKFCQLHLLIETSPLWGRGAHGEDGFSTF